MEVQVLNALKQRLKEEAEELDVGLVNGSLDGRALSLAALGRGLKDTSQVSSKFNEAQSIGLEWLALKNLLPHNTKFVATVTSQKHLEAELGRE